MAGEHGGAHDPGPEPIRVMIVDDSVVVRSALRRLLEAAPDIEVAAAVTDGRAAIDGARRLRPEVVLLDVEMPVLDGLQALPELLRLEPPPKVIMASTLTREGAAVTVEALARGASDYLPKPGSRDELAGEAFRRELLVRVRALAHARRRKLLRKADFAAAPRRAPALRPALQVPPEAIAVGSSTGGPQALLALFRGLGRPPPCPVLVTQHMPATFTALLARQIEAESGLACAEAEDGEPLRPGRVYVAPGGRHLEVRRKGEPVLVRLSQEAPENHCRPAVDPMLRSLAQAYGGRVLAVILTGMGRDGLRGAERVVEAGGGVIVQDEATSVVWGMPGAVARRGLASAILPLEAIAARLRELSASGRP